jgi:hypothetical protein
MPRRFPVGNGLLRTIVPAAFFLTFLGCLAAVQTAIAAQQTGKSSAFSISNAVAETGLSCVTGTHFASETDLALDDQDPIETFRLDSDEGGLRTDRVTLGPKNPSQHTCCPSVDLSSPLLE